MATTALLEVNGLTRAFGGVRAVDGMNISLAAGGLLAIIGPNGCGKTTFFNLVTGNLTPDAGAISFAGHDITGLKPHAIARLGIGRKFQVPGIYPGLDVSENLEIAFAAATGARGIGGIFAHRDRWAARQDEILATVGLAGKAGAVAGSLAHGQKQWLEIAMLLASAPRLMLLDEPTAGMTVAEAEATAQLIQGLNRDRGLAVIVIEHDMEFVETLDCEVAVMMKGAILRRGRYSDLRDDAQVRQVYLGDAA